MPKPIRNETLDILEKYTQLRQTISANTAHKKKDKKESRNEVECFRYALDSYK